MPEASTDGGGSYISVDTYLRPPTVGAGGFLPVVPKFSPRWGRDNSPTSPRESVLPFNFRKLGPPRRLGAPMRSPRAAVALNPIEHDASKGLTQAPNQAVTGRSTHDAAAKDQGKERSDREYIGTWKENLRSIQGSFVADISGKLPSRRRSALPF